MWRFNLSGRGDQVGDELVQILLSSPNAAALRFLGIYHVEMSLDVVISLFKSDFITQLEELWFYSSNFNEQWAERFLAEDGIRFPNCGVMLHASMSREEVRRLNAMYPEFEIAIG